MSELEAGGTGIMVTIEEYNRLSETFPITVKKFGIGLEEYLAQFIAQASYEIADAMLKARGQ